MDVMPRTALDGVMIKTQEVPLPSAIKAIQIPDGPKILMVDDVYGDQTVPIVVPTIDKLVAPILSGIYPRGWESHEVVPDYKQIINFTYCTSILKMPVQYATFLAFGTNYNVDETYFPIPNEGIKIPLTVAMRGESSPEKGGKGVGKSTLSAVLSARLTKSGLNVAIFDFEPFYNEGASLYLQALQSSNWDGSFDHAVHLINEIVWHGGQQKKPGRLKSVKEIMEGDRTGQGIKFFRDTTTRPDIIIFDMPGVPGVTKDHKGEITSSRRPKNVYDLFGLGADVVFHTDRFVLTMSKYSKVEPIERKLAFFQKIVEDNLRGK